MRGLVEKLEYATANDPGIAQSYTAPAPRLKCGMVGSISTQNPKS